MKKIRVLQIISGFSVEGPLGGIERFGIELAQALALSADIEPVVCGMWAFATAYEHRWLDRLKDQDIDAFMPAAWHERSPYGSFWRALQGTRRYLQGQRVDIIHSHCQFGDIMALLLKRELGARAVVRTVHNEREWGKRPLRRLLLTGGLYPIFFQQELGVAQQVVDNLDRRPLAGWLRRKAIRAYNALNLDRFEGVAVDKAAKRHSLGIPPEARVVGSVGRLTTQKAYDVFLEAAAQIRTHHSDVHFLLIGEGELEEVLRAQAERLSLIPHVTFTGPRTDVEELLQIMDVFVNSSRWEGLPTVILESMAARVPVVATGVSGNRELVQDGVSGRLVPAENPQALAQTIQDVLALPGQRRQLMCEAAYDFISANFSIKQVAAQHQQLYRRLL